MLGSEATIARKGCQRWNKKAANARAKEVDESEHSGLRKVQVHSIKPAANQEWRQGKCGCPFTSLLPPTPVGKEQEELMAQECLTMTQEKGGRLRAWELTGP